MSKGRPGFFDRFVRLHAQSSSIGLTNALTIGAFVIFAVSAAIMIAGAVVRNDVPPAETLIGAAVFFLISVLGFAIRRRRRQLGLPDTPR